MRTHKANSLHGACRNMSDPHADIAPEHIAEQVVRDFCAVDADAASVRCGKAQQKQVSVPRNLLIEYGETRPDAAREDNATAEPLEDAGHPSVAMRARAITRRTLADVAHDLNPPIDSLLERRRQHADALRIGIGSEHLDRAGRRADVLDEPSATNTEGVSSGGSST